MPVAPVSAVNAVAPVAAAAEAALLAGQTIEATLLALIGDGSGGSQQAVLSLGGRTVRAVIDPLPPGTASPSPNQRVLVVLTPEAQALATRGASPAGRTDARDPRQPDSAAPPEAEDVAPGTLLLRASALKIAFAAALGGRNASVSEQGRTPGAALSATDGASRSPAQPAASRLATIADPAALLRASLPAVVSAQGGSARLFADLPALTGPDTPEPIREAARALLALRLDPEAPDVAPALKTAFARSGLFFERSLRDGAPAADLKAALLALKAALPAPASEAKSAEGPDHQPAAPVQPPLRDVAPRGEAPAPAIPQTELPTALSAVRTETESGLARLQLAQIASLDAAPLLGAAEPPGRQWTFELPLVLRDGTGIAQFRLVEEREARTSRVSAADPAKRWRLRFSVATTQDGAVDAEVSAQGGRVAVAIRAERDDTAERLIALRDVLLATLESGGVDTVGVDIRAGRLPAPPVSPGRVLDRVS